MADETQKTGKHLLSKHDVHKAALTWWTFSHITYNYQRMQAGAIATFMGPILNKLYHGDKKKISEGLTRHMLFFNTEPRIGAFLPGMTVALEEGIADPDNNNSDPSMITQLKTALMGPLAGIGDTLWSGLLKPIVLSIFLGWAKQGAVWAAWGFGLTFLALDFILTFSMFNEGYKLGIKSIDKFLEGPLMKKLTYMLGMIGLFCLGAMIVKYVSVAPILVLHLSTGKIAIDKILNQVMPSMIPLALVLLAFWLQRSKGMSVNKVLLILFAIGFIGGAVGFLG